MAENNTKLDCLIRLQEKISEKLDQEKQKEIIPEKLGRDTAELNKAKAALEDAGYTVILNDGGLIGSALLPEGAEATLVAVKGDDEYISITYYKDKDALNDAWDKIEDDIKEIKEEYEDVVCKKSGNMIYFGTKQAVKDAR